MVTKQHRHSLGFVPGRDFLNRSIRGGHQAACLETLEATPLVGDESIFWSVNILSFDGNPLEDGGRKEA